MAELNIQKYTKKQHAAARAKMFKKPKKRVKKPLPLISITIRGAADHDRGTRDAVMHWLELQKLDYARGHTQYDSNYTARYYRT